MCSQLSKLVLLAIATAWLVLVHAGVGVAQGVGIERLIRFYGEVRSMEGSSSFQRLKQRAAVLSNDAAKQDDAATARDMAEMASERAQGGTSGGPLSANVIGAVIAAKLAPEKILQAAPLVSLEARRHLTAALEHNPEIRKRITNIDQIFVSPSPSTQQQQASRLEAIRRAVPQAVTTITDLYKQGAQKCALNEEENRREVDRLSNDLLEISRLKDACAARSNAEIMEDSHCRCLVYPTDRACQCRMNPKQPMCNVRHPCDGSGSAWKLDPRDRGIEIENRLAATEYAESKGWSHVGKTYRGFMPYFDFSNPTTFLQLKTIDTAGASWPAPGSSWSDRWLTNRTLTTLQKLGEIKMSYPNKEVVLEILVQPDGLKREGAAAAARTLISHGEELGIKVVIRECK